MISSAAGSFSVTMDSLRVFLDEERRVDQLAVDPPGERRLGKAGADTGRNFRDRDGSVECFLAAVRQRNDWHRCLAPASLKKQNEINQLRAAHRAKPDAQNQFRQGTRGFADIDTLPRRFYWLP